MALIVSLHQKFKPTTIIASHDLRRLLPVVDQIVAIFDGKVRFVGTLEQLRDFDSPNVRKFVSCRFDIQTEEATL
jgi:ABC-type transporter Mla maintaining outer membrane lipid asymmetry ATPase subunit MlaF